MSKATEPRAVRRPSRSVTVMKRMGDVVHRDVNCHQEHTDAGGEEESTIRTHVKHILMKLDLRDRVQVVIFAYETGFMRPGVGCNRAVL